MEKEKRSLPITEVGMSDWKKVVKEVDEVMKRWEVKNVSGGDRATLMSRRQQPRRIRTSGTDS